MKKRTMLVLALALICAVTLSIAAFAATEGVTVTYLPGTSDSVSGMPDAGTAEGNVYQISSTIPERAGYVFLGWTVEFEEAVEAEVEPENTEEMEPVVDELLDPEAEIEEEITEGEEVITDEPIEEITDEPIEEIIEEPAEEISEEPVEEITEETVEEISEESGEPVEEIAAVNEAAEETEVGNPESDEPVALAEAPAEGEEQKPEAVKEAAKEAVENKIEAPAAEEVIVES